MKLTQEILQKFKEDKLDSPLKDYSYLLHHVEIDDQGDEELHHCFVYDHLGNMFIQSHIKVIDGKCYDESGKPIQNGIFHIITGLEPKQDVCWSNEDAKDKGITPKSMVAGMSYKDKSKKW